MIDAIESWVCMHGVDVIVAGGCADCNEATTEMLSRVRPYRIFPSSRRKMPERRTRPEGYKEGYAAGYNAALRRNGKVQFAVKT